MNKKLKYGLIGYPLSHTFSPPYFAEKFQNENITNIRYDAYSLESIEEIVPLFSSGIAGLNVTIPYKEKVIPYLDELSEEAEKIGAVNTIKVVNGKKIGYNTDVYGFEHSLLDLIQENKIEKAFILGTGGASKAVKYVLDKLEIESHFISRNPELTTYDQITKDMIYDTKLIVNTTPLGMYPKIDLCPQLPYDALGREHFLYDLVYNPEKTLFLKKGKIKKARIKNGHDMLILQAEKSWEIWNQN